MHPPLYRLLAEDWQGLFGSAEAPIFHPEILLIGQAPDCSEWLVISTIPHAELTEFDENYSRYDFIYRQEWGLVIDDAMVQRAWDDAVETDWDGMNAAIMSNPEFNVVYAAVLASHPIIAASLPAALTQVANGQTGMFELLYSQMCAVAEVSPAQREIWAGMAESFYAPSSFVDIVRGAPDGE